VSNNAVSGGASDEEGWLSHTDIRAADSVLTTALNAYLTRERPDRYEVAASKLLREMLEKGSKWRSLSSLAIVIGASEQDTKEMLLILGARASERNPELWGLVSRNPLPDWNQRNLSEAK